MNESFEIWFARGRKHCGKRRTGWLPTFSPFPTMFSKDFFPKVVEGRGCVEGQDFVTPHAEPLTTQSRLLIPLERKAFENIVGKGENAGNQHFLLFPQCFLLLPTPNSIFESQLFCQLQML